MGEFKRLQKELRTMAGAACTHGHGQRQTV
jgi:hypothetical protein